MIVMCFTKEKVLYLHSFEHLLSKNLCFKARIVDNHFRDLSASLSLQPCQIISSFEPSLQLKYVQYHIYTSYILYICPLENLQFVMFRVCLSSLSRFDCPCTARSGGMRFHLGGLGDGLSHSNQWKIEIYIRKAGISDWMEGWLSCSHSCCSWWSW